MTETEMTYSRSENHTRTVRGGRRKKGVTAGEKVSFQAPPMKVWPAFLWSLLLSVLSVANPYLIQLATNLQSQDLYAGMAMQAGQNPYGQFFGTNGVLYYLLLYVGSFFDSTIGIAGIQFIALLVTGIYFYKISAYLSRSSRVATCLQHWFYMFLLVVNIGGVQASVFVLPVLLTSLWFLIRYFERAVRDEAFILYGIDAAIAFLLYPKSSVLWLVSILVLLVYNAVHRQIGRGIYQALATVFGFLLIVYSVGYYTFIAQILGAAIQQTVLYGLNLTLSHPGLLATVALVGCFLLLSGFLKNVVHTIASLGQKRHTYIKVVVLLTFIIQLFLIIFNQPFSASQLALLLPYGFIMALFYRHAEQDEIKGYSYLKSSFYLPLLLCLGILFQPVKMYIIDGELAQERVSVADYIRSHSQETDTIYAWDDSAQMYLQSGRLSAGVVVTPTPYLDNQSNQDSIIFDLNQNEARYIVVNSRVAMLDNVKSNLETNYEKIELGTQQLTLYEKTQ